MGYWAPPVLSNLGNYLKWPLMDIVKVAIDAGQLWTFWSGNTLSLNAHWFYTSWLWSRQTGYVGMHDSTCMYMFLMQVPNTVLKNWMNDSVYLSNTCLHEWLFSLCVQSQTAPLWHLTYLFFFFLFFLTLIQPPSLTPLSHPHPPSLSPSLSVSDRVCYMSRLPACSVPTSPSSGDVVSSPLSPGNRRVRSPPRGAGVGREGEEREETSRFFLGFFFSLSFHSKVSVIQIFMHVRVHALGMKASVPSLRNGDNSRFVY